MKRVGIYQNTITSGGRIKVIAAMTYVFNEMGLTPDWIAFRNTLSHNELNNIISKDIRARFKILRNFTKGLSEFKYVRMNQRMSKLPKEYDLIVNSNNTLVYSSDNENVIHYIHFPREARLLEKYSNSTIQYRFTKTLFKKMYNSFLSDAKPKGIFIANSEFTKSAMLDVYPLQASDIFVLYPPVQRPSNSLKGTRKVPNKVLSLGRFGVNKDQLFQINLAEIVPEGEFFIMGFVNNNKSLRYYKQCQRAIKSKGIKNVRLVKDADKDLVQKELKSASVFLHTMVDEPFGIATVESLFYGCLPLSHNSGGQREIINDERLLYSSLSDAESKLRQLMKLDHSVSEELLKVLQNRITIYSFEKFVSKFENVLKGINFV